MAFSFFPASEASLGIGLESGSSLFRGRGVNKWVGGEKGRKHGSGKGVWKQEHGWEKEKGRQGRGRRAVIVDPVDELAPMSLSRVS